MKYIPIVVSLFCLTGCNPFSERQNLTKIKVDKADKAAITHTEGRVANIREIKDYKPYQLLEKKVNDPFKAKQFLVLEDKSVDKNKNLKCIPPECSAPKEHKKTFLEDYALSELVFVGTLSKSNHVALIKTPDVGVVRVKTGDYMGRNNGKILEIQEAAVIIQEKVYMSGIWKNKKSVLMINR
ncbi:MAG: pilus assembly protein PilP [Gammaproteobacteria bacterium]|nr:pilus assembly protein PilP [Gammaproteobacteria bacterium]